MTPVVSVVIPTFNRGFCIGAAVDSVLRQTRPPDEIIVVDDGSTDDTPERLAAYGDRIRYVQHVNSGVSAARNGGILVARSNWIAFLDSDDEWLPSKLETQLTALQADPRLIAHACNARTNAGMGRTIDFFSLGDQLGILGENQSLERPLAHVLAYRFCTPALVVRRAALLAAGLFDTRMALFEDLDLMARVACLGPWGVSSRVLVHVLRRGNAADSLSFKGTRDAGAASMGMVHMLERLRVGSRLSTL